MVPHLVHCALLPTLSDATFNSCLHVGQRNRMWSLIVSSSITSQCRPDQRHCNPSSRRMQEENGGKLATKLRRGWVLLMQFLFCALLDRLSLVQGTASVKPQQDHNTVLPPLAA